MILHKLAFNFLWKCRSLESRSLCDWTYIRSFSKLQQHVTIRRFANQEIGNPTIPSTSRVPDSNDGCLRLSSRSLWSPVLIGVAGGTASGKTTFCEEIIKRLDVDRNLVSLISQDSFYRDLNTCEKAEAYRGDFNFDHPNAVDHKLLQQTLDDIRHGKSVSIPIYDFRTHSRLPNERTQIGHIAVLLVEGILVFYLKEIRQLFDIKLFVDVDADIRLERRIRRDIDERGRDLNQILHQYLTLVKPAFDEFCFPTKKYADLIVPRGAENRIAVDMVSQQIQNLLRNPRNGDDRDLKNSYQPITDR